MMHTLKDLEGFVIHAIDGSIGKVKDFYFDDRYWVIRHLVVETGSWLENRKILLSPVSIKHLNREDKTLIVDLSISDVKNSPHIDMHRPISQQYEIDYLSYYGYSFYWGNNETLDATVGMGNVLADAPEKDVKAEAFATIDTVRRMHGDRHLRSCNEIIGYHIKATDGEIGHMDEMLINEDTWAVRYLIANTSNWWLGHQVLIDPQTIQDISWGNSKVYVDMTQQQVQTAPLFDPSVPLNRQKEMGVYLHYDRAGYWEDEIKTERL